MTLPFSDVSHVLFFPLPTLRVHHQISIVSPRLHAILPARVLLGAWSGSGYCSHFHYTLWRRKLTSSKRAWSSHRELDIFQGIFLYEGVSCRFLALATVRISSLSLLVGPPPPSHFPLLTDFPIRSSSL